MDSILSALNKIPVSELSYQEWINIGMALKHEGYDCSVWENWSQADCRYHEGECARKWKTFQGSASPVTGATIIKSAEDYGWSYSPEDGCLDWDSVISDDGEYISPTSISTSDLISYLETLFEPDEYVSYVTESWRCEDGKYRPCSTGSFDRTSAELISALKKHPDDIGAVTGDWNKEAGAWIRFNPVDGKGVKNANVTAYRFALVESDSMPIEEQYEVYRKLELPIAALVHSGGKSLHAIVHIDAADSTEYSSRVNFLFDFLVKKGVTIDKQNRNPSRLSRMPGVTRNGKRQYLMATNIGRRSWADWMDYADGDSDELPGFISLNSFIDNPPELPPELITGILRCGHKMLISGSSKAGKSFLLMELCIALAEGKEWLGFKCKKSKVLYVNLEIDPASCINRFHNIYEALGYERRFAEDIKVWNLRGHAVPLDKLVPKLLRRAKNQGFDAIVVDPIYKVITGDENNASDMAGFCNQFDRICTETGCAVIYCHHHSKGAQGAKKAMDRASGSGVFARDPDAQLDMIELELTEHMKNTLSDNVATAWRLESSLREFRNIRPVNFWFEYPIHRVDTTGELDKAAAEGSPECNLTKSSKYTTKTERADSLDEAYDACSLAPPVTIKSMAEYLGVTERCVRDRLKESDDIYRYWNGKVERIYNDGKAEISLFP